MVKEAYCSFEVSKLLRAKRFDWDCITYYVDSEPDNVKYSMLFENNNTWEDRCCSAPTHQMAMKWLREEKNILIYVYPVIDLPVKNNYTFHWRWDGKKKRHDAPHIGNKHNYESFEEAVEAAIKYTLENLI
jgi:hypothetical protein